MLRRTSLVTFVCSMLAFIAGPSARADVKLPAIFSEHMVLQQSQEVPVWGWAEPGEKVTVAIAGKIKEATAGADGKWTVTTSTPA